MVNTIATGPTRHPQIADDLANARRRSRWAAWIATAIAIPIVGAALLFVFVLISFSTIGGSGSKYAWLLYLVSALVGLMLVAAIAAIAHQIAFGRSENRAVGEAPKAKDESAIKTLAES